QVFLDTLNISSAAGPKGKTKATSLWMQFEQLLDGTQSYEDRKGLIELLDDIKRLTCQRVMPNGIEPHCPQQRHRVVICPRRKPLSRMCSAFCELHMHILSFGKREDGSP